LKKITEASKATKSHQQKERQKGRAKLFALGRLNRGASGGSKAQSIDFLDLGESSF
jgi:hypothetical protein